MLFSEDNINTASSIMLSRVVNIEFKNSNTNLLDESIHSEDSIILVDVVPGKDSIIGLYEDLLSLSIKSGSSVIPIICMEYYIVMSLFSLGYKLNYRYKWLLYVKEAILQKKGIRKAPPKKLGYRESLRTFEKQCKLFLNNIDIQYENVNINKCRNGVGAYYVVGNDIVLNQRAIEICRHLPIVVFKNSMPDGFSNVSNIREIAFREQKKFEAWCNNYSYLDLPDNWWL